MSTCLLLVRTQRHTPHGSAAPRGAPMPAAAMVVPLLALLLALLLLTTAVALYTNTDVSTLGVSQMEYLSFVRRPVQIVEGGGGGHGDGGEVVEVSLRRGDPTAVAVPTRDEAEGAPSTSTDDGEDDDVEEEDAAVNGLEVEAQTTTTMTTQKAVDPTDVSAADLAEARSEWWTGDPPGVDTPLQAQRRRLWEFELDPSLLKRSATTRRFPHLAFVKGLKVGGTSIALALDNAARAYNVTVSSRGHPETCSPLSSLHYHHGGALSPGFICIPSPRFVTLLREPVAQALSWEVMELHRPFFMRPTPTQPCPAQLVERARVMPSPQRALHMIAGCQNDELRKALTMRAIALRIGSKWGTRRRFVTSSALAHTFAWITQKRKGGPASRDSAVVLNALASRFFLVGVTERLNEFLVLLSAHVGWDPAKLVYRRCKSSPVTISLDEFKAAFPAEAATLESHAAFAVPAYERAREDFDAHVRKLGAWFPRLVSTFEVALKQYQATTTPREGWTQVTYVDGVTEMC